MNVLMHNASKAKLNNNLSCDCHIHKKIILNVACWKFKMHVNFEFCNLIFEALCWNTARMKCLKTLCTTPTTNGFHSILHSLPSSSIFQDTFGSKWKVVWWNFSEKEPLPGILLLLCKYKNLIWSRSIWRFWLVFL